MSDIAIKDRKLPSLAQAQDDEAMRTLLSAHLARYTGNQELRQLRHRMLKHTPGKRCVIEYWLESNSNPGGTQRVIGKLYRKNRGEKIFKSMLKLWQAGLGRSQKIGFGMPAPLAYVPEIGMIVQNVVPGRPLHDFSLNEDLTAAVWHVAHNLALLHSLPATVGEPKSWDYHIKKYCHPGPQALMAACPELAPLVAGILEGLAKDESLPRVPGCLVHGDLGPAQVFITSKQAFFIDFDGVCFSHAALDLGNFLVALQIHFGSRGEELAKIFIATYWEHQTPEKLAGLHLYQALAYLRRAMIGFRWQSGAEWRQQVGQLLEAGNAALKDGLS